MLNDSFVSPGDQNSPPPPPFWGILVLKENEWATWVVTVVSHKHRAAAEILPSEKSSPEWLARPVWRQNPGCCRARHLQHPRQATAAARLTRPLTSARESVAPIGHGESFAPSATSGVNFILSYSSASWFSIFPSPEAGATEVKIITFTRNCL